MSLQSPVSSPQPPTASEPWTLIEPCCGSAAVTLALLGAKQGLLPYQGAKWRLRKPIIEHIRKFGFEGPPSAIELHDAGPWGAVMLEVISHSRREKLVAELMRMSKIDPAVLYRALQGAKLPTNDTRYAAEFLFLQRLSFSGKAVGVRGGAWNSPGFNKTSAYGVAATQRFGEVGPMLDSLIRTLQGYDLSIPRAGWRFGVTDAEFSTESLRERRLGGALVYLDPPYVGQTPYPNGTLSRERVVELATRFRNEGASVIVSEGEPVEELVSHGGWSTTCLSTGRPLDGSPFKSKGAEWLTWAPSLQSSVFSLQPPSATQSSGLT